MPSVARSLRSKQGHVIIDEAAFVDDLFEVISTAMALEMWGGSVSILSTHFGDGNPFNILIGKIHAGEFEYSLHKTTAGGRENSFIDIAKFPPYQVFLSKNL